VLILIVAHHVLYYSSIKHGRLKFGELNAQALIDGIRSTDSLHLNYMHPPTRSVIQAQYSAEYETFAHTVQ
jgi:hypothetical protein